MEVWKYGTEVCKLEKKKQENYCNRLYKKERENCYKNLDPKVLEDERKFWLTVKPFFNDKNCGIREKITLVENGELIDEDMEVAELFNAFFANSVNTLGIIENKLLLNPICDSDVGVEKCINMYETHPSIVNIRRHVGESGQMCTMSRPRDFVPSARFLQKTMLLLVPHKS